MIKNILAPSMLSIDFNHMEKNLRAVIDAGAEYIHVDVMDGLFVPNISFGPPVMKYVRKAAYDAVMDVHLMVTEPERYIELWKESGADIVTVHYEAVKDMDRAIDGIHSAGMKVGVSIKPATPVHVLKDIIPRVEMVLIMSVEPGFGGQSFIEESYNRIRETRKLADSLNKEIDIEVDGGINIDNVADVLSAGANVIVAGSAVFNNDPAINTKRFLEKMAR